MRTAFDTIARIAGRQHGRITHAQLLVAGADRDGIKRWCADGLLDRVHREVYAVGHTAPSLHADLMAAVLACGPGAAASHRSAGHSLGILRARPPWPEVTVPTTAGRRRPGILVHRVRALDPDDVTKHVQIPTTIVPRVLLDLAPRLPPAALTRACHEAWIRHGTTTLTSRPASLATRRRRARRSCSARSAQTSHSVPSRTASSSCSTVTASRGRVPTRTATATRWTATGRGKASRSSCSAIASTPAAKHSRPTFARRRRSRHVAYTYGDVFERGDETAAELAALLGG